MKNKVAIVPALLLAALALQGCAVGSQQSAGLTPRQISDAGDVSGDAAMAAGKISDAADIYGHGWDTRHTASLGAKRGLAMRMSGDPQGAVVFLRVAQAEYPNDVAIALETALAAMAGGYIPEAGEALDKAVSLPGAGWSVYNALGAYKARLDDLDAASAAFEHAASLATSDRDRSSAQANVAMIRAQKGDLPGAIGDLLLIARKPGVHPKVHAALALLYGLDGDMPGFYREASGAGLEPQAIQDVAAWLSGAGARQPAAAKLEVTTPVVADTSTPRRRIQETPSVKPVQPRPRQAQEYAGPTPVRSTSAITLLPTVPLVSPVGVSPTKFSAFNPAKAMGLE